MATEEEKAINDKIWITSRIRMISERKALRLQNISYIAIIYYSVFTIIISIFESYYSDFYHALSQISLSSSVVVLVFSLVTAGFRFEARAGSFRECYLKLQRLHDEDISGSEKKMKYHDILADFPNHSDTDYGDLLVNHILFEGKRLTNNGKNLTYTWYMMISFCFRRLAFYLLFIIMFFAPLFFLILPFWTRT